MMLAISMPLAVMPPTGGSPLRFPSVASVRHSVYHLLDWIAGRNAPAPPTPRQQAAGTAAGLAHQVPAAVTRAVTHAAGLRPQHGPGQVAPYSPHAPAAHSFVAGPAPGTSTFNPATSKPVASATTATSDLYQNTDGTYTRLVYAGPVNYRTAAGAWTPIDTSLSSQTGGRWQERANSLAVSFAARADDPTLGSLAAGSGNPGSFGISFSLAGAAGAPGTAAGSVVTYPNVLPNTDLTETATATGINESLVLHSAQAPTTWVFPLQLAGLTAVLESDGSVGLVGSSGLLQGVIPAGLATDSATAPGAGPAGQVTPVTYQLISYQGGQALQASIAPAWLASPARVFPVTVDPSYNATTTGSTEVMYPYTNDYSGNTLLQVGTYDSGSNYARSFLAFNGLGSALANEHITAASLHIWDAWAWTCSTAEPFWANEITQSWSVTGNKSWAGPSTGAGMGELDTTAPSAACTNTSGNPAVGGWMTMTMSSGGVGILNDWTLHPSDDNGIALTNSTTDNTQWKQFDSFHTANAPYLALTYTPDVPPQIDSQYPPDNYNATSLTPELLATGHDPDTWPNSSVQYDFTVYNSSGTKVASSGNISAGDWTVPKGDLAWGQTYYWTVQDYDGLDYSAEPQINYLSTPVPQPLITSGLSQNDSGPGFDPATGDYTTSATDAQVPTVGPSLSVQRDYNSLDPRTSGAFGAGWSSVLDMKVGPGETDSSGVTATEVVTYPDGEQVGFGLNANGTYSPPPGRYATLASVSGGFTLTDKNDTVYTFTQSLGSSQYGLTSIADALGHTETFGYNSAGEITTVTSASGRALHVSWSTPSGAAYPHVATVVTDPVTPGNQATALTWGYGYAGDRLTSVCPPVSTTQCTTYAYSSGSDYQNAVLDSGPHSYWRLDETSGTTAASSVLVNEGTDNATYSGVTLGQPGPLAGSSATSAGFNGSSSYVQLPTNLVSGASYQSVSLWFKTTSTAGEVLFSYQSSTLSAGTTPGGYTPSLYVGTDGKLNGEFWYGTTKPITSSGSVADGNWHLVTLSAAGNTQSLYLDGRLVGTASGTVSATGLDNDYVGAGFIGGGWPDEPHQGQNGNTGYASYFNGNISDATFWDRPLTAASVAAMYAAGTQQASLLNKVTRPSGSIYSQVTYNPLTSAVTNVTDSNGSSWSLAAPTVTGSSQKYVSAVLGANPEDYWRLADTGTTDAVNQMNGGTATYNNVTQGVSGGPFSDTTVDSFNGTSSYLQLPSNLLTSGGNESISLWFKTSSPGGVLFSTSADPVTNGTTPGNYASELYLGQGGDLNAEFWNGSADPMVTAKPLDDGKWHNVVLSAGTTSEVVFVDGQQAGTLSGTVSAVASTYTYLGAGFLGGSWPNEPHQSSTSNTGYATYFNGDIAEVSYYASEVGQVRATDEWNASKYSSGLTPVQTEMVTDPAGKTVSYTFDPLNGNRVLSQTNALGDTTTYGYDANGFQDIVVDPDGDTTSTGYDVRGNAVSRTTCQNQAAQQCSTSYYSYYPDDTSSSLTPDPRNDVMLTDRDPRSASDTDNTYLTTYAYNSLGRLTSVTTPPVAGFGSGRATTYAYTDGTDSTGGYNGAVPPKGLQYQETSPGGAVTTTLYDSNGDIAEIINPDGLQTTYVYDGVGRVTAQSVVSDSYPSGLTTSYAYNADGQVVTQTDPPVTDRVTGATHTAQTTTVYDADGNVTSQTVADTTGGDSSRAVSYVYNSNDLIATSTNATGGQTKYTYGAYGDLAAETDPAGNVTAYTYDPDGNLTTVTLENYTGSPPGSQTAAPLVESSRAYDPAGRLASVTDSMGFVTSYGYTDDGLLATVTRGNPATGASYTEESDVYDAAGNVVQQVTDNGGTTTDYTVDAADRTTQQTEDPSGVDRSTTVSYTPDDQPATVTRTDGTGATQVTSRTYDPAGNQTSQSVYSDGSGHPSGWWRLNQTSGTTVTDSSGTGNTASATGVTWSGGAASFAGTTGQQIATNGPVLDTAASFSVSAWVNLASTANASQTFVSQSGSVDSAFFLKYTSGNWGFTMPESDTTSPPSARATAPASSPVGTWTHLVGTYNSSTGTLTLYVNGSAAATATNTTPFAANGALDIGRSLFNGAAADLVDGSVSDVQVYPRVLSSSEVTGLYQAGRSGGTTASSSALTTAWTLDERGLPTSMTDPDGNVTNYTYDEAGRRAVITQPAVSTETGGGTPVMARPVYTTGYDTFGDKTETEDPDGNVASYGYDAEGRQVSQTLPPYTPPGSGIPITAETSQVYNSLGQVISATDPLNNQTSYAYDQLGDLSTVTAPNTGVTSYRYDTNGDQLSVTSPTGAQAQATFDYLGRPLTSTQLERYPSPASYTTTNAYTASSSDPGGSWMSSSTSPDGVVTSYGYDALGEKTAVTNGAGNTTSYGYDFLGRRTAVGNPDGTSQTTAYDALNDPVTQSNVNASGAVLTSQSATYDGDGNLLSSTDARGDPTTYTYGPTGLLAQEVQPVSATSSITTSFGYDAAGNRTRYTDGRGNSWIYTYNSWNLPESAIEPATSAYSSPADSTFTTAYDADGRPATKTEPGGVTITDSYDSVGDLTGQSGSGADAATPTRAFGYDLAGNITSASTSGVPNPTSETFTYDDRGLVTSATGSAGSSSYTYNGDALPSSVADAAGATSYTYDNADRLATLADPATGTTAAYSYTNNSQVSQISYGSGNNVQNFAYNDLHQLTSDTLQTSASTTIASAAYGYGANGNITSINTAGLAGATSNTYSYDEANRLTSWDNGTATTSYGYDASGNLTQNGSKTYSYDARDELTSDGTNTYSYTANGTVSSEVTPAGTVTSSFDAYGEQATSGTQSYAYDALGRMLSDTGGSQNFTFSYRGSSGTLASDGTSTYTWDPSGTVLTGIGVAGGGPSQGVLALTDQHGDVLGNFTASASSLSASTSYDPWGTVTATAGAMSGRLGYQSGWTDAATGKVAMGARWYSPATGGFSSADTVAVSPVPASAAANPFAYAGDDPLDMIDPTGHLMICNGYTCGSLQSFQHPHTCNAACQTATAFDDAQAGIETATQGLGLGSWSAPSCSGFLGCLVHTVERIPGVRQAVGFVNRTVDYARHIGGVILRAPLAVVRRAVKDLSTAVSDAARWGAHAAAATFRRAVSAGSRAYHAVTTYAVHQYRAVVNTVRTAYHAVARAATATVSYVKHHAATIASIAASTLTFVGCEATLGVATAGVGTIACGALAGAVGSAVSYGITAAQTGHFSWAGLGVSVLTGALAGAAGAGLGELAGAAGGLLASGTEDAAAAMATTGVDEATTGVADAAGDSAGEAAGARATPPGEVAGEPAAGDGPSCTIGGQSFSAGTKVLLANGKTVPISKLKPGQKVLATDTRTGKNHAETVTAVLVHDDRDLYDLTVRLAGRTAVIDTTSNHLFWDPYLKRWVTAAKLKSGEHLKTPNGQDTVADGGSIPADHDGWMWDLTIQDDHDFYVEPAVVLPPIRAGPTPVQVLVHNCGGTVYRVIRPDEDPSVGLFPKNPDANVSIDEHVRYGSRPGFESQWISATKNLDVARGWAARSGNRIVSIDLGQVNGEIIDLSTYQDRAYYLLDWKGRGYAMKSEEVLINGTVPASAIDLVP